MSSCSKCKDKCIWALESHSNENVRCGLLGCDSMWFCRWLPVSQRNILPPFSDDFTLKTEMICFSTMLVTIYKTTWCHYPEDWDWPKINVLIKALVSSFGICMNLIFICMQKLSCSSVHYSVISLISTTFFKVTEYLKCYYCALEENNRRQMCLWLWTCKNIINTNIPSCMCIFTWSLTYM